MSPYFGIVIMLAIASAFVGLTVLTSILVGPGVTTAPSTTRTSAASSRPRSRSVAGGSR